MNNEESIIVHKCGASSSEAPAFHLIPLSAVLRLAARYKAGAVKHGPMNWRKGLGQTPPPQPSILTEYCIERLNHVIYHAFKLIAKLQGFRPQDGDDDAGAIMWGGAFAGEFMDQDTNLAAKDRIEELTKL